ncbi:hypothetical protein PanWU01x14_053910 [Parasponia andersonii]|uniref:Uncharacterized protein n=1 Tax=Parasponia andersonii TaxID=3476 RepID=A0A2P5DKL7_PARAD|nr:hypothetical protein PanWU01x14_053910 [Parasponia andersonii]
MLRLGVWDDQKLLATFSKVDKNVILSLPLSCNPGVDQLIWHFKKSGEYYEGKEKFTLLLIKPTQPNVGNSYGLILFL